VMAKHHALEMPLVLNTVVDAPVAEDDYFRGEDDVVAVFDFDYEEIVKFQTQLGWMMFTVFPPAWALSLCCAPCVWKKNIQWKVRSQHIALTSDGIRYVKEKHPTLCGLSCTDSEEENTVLHYDAITDCDAREPASSSCCCCVKDTLSKVIIDTTSSKGGHGLSLSGLKHAHEFKKAVWAMKRGEVPRQGPLPALSHSKLAPLAAQQQQQASIKCIHTDAVIPNGGINELHQFATLESDMDSDADAVI